jgi:Ras-related protein Rab-6A
VGVDFSSKTLKFRGKSLKLQLWDSAGQEKYKSLIPSYIRGSSIIFVCYDITSIIDNYLGRESFNNVPEWIQFVKNIENTMIVLCGNKLDIAAERYYFGLFRKVTADEAEKFSQKYKILNFEISAKTGENMSKMIYYTIAKLPFFEQFMIESDMLIKELGILKCYLRK